MNVASLEIIGYEDIYTITPTGEVTTILRKGSHGTKRRVQTNRYGYKYVGLTKDGKRRNHTLHRLLAIHFIPNPNGYQYVNHINGDKGDNRLENLEWCTSSQNNAHAYSTGLKIPNTLPKTPKFSEQQIVKIRNWRLQGYSNTQIAERFGVHHDTIWRITTRRTWGHI